jgi:hypothetical protein
MDVALAVNIDQDSIGPAENNFDSVGGLPSNSEDDPVVDDF